MTEDPTATNRAMLPSLGQKVKYRILSILFMLVTLMRCGPICQFMFLTMIVCHSPQLGLKHWRYYKYLFRCEHRWGRLLRVWESHQQQPVSHWCGFSLQSGREASVRTQGAIERWINRRVQIWRIQHVHDVCTVKCGIRLCNSDVL